MSQQAERKPPFSLEAEMSVLGGMLIDPNAIAKAVETLNEEMFYRDSHRRLYRALIRLWERGEAVDPVTLSNHLKNAGDFDSVGGAPYMAQLWDYVPTAANLEYHAKIVREKAVLRRLIDAGTSIVTSAFENQGELDRLLDEAEQKVFQVAQAQERRGFVWVKELLWPAMEMIELLGKNSSAITGVPSGFRDLDHLTAGFQNGDLIIVAARPSMGKCLAADSEIVLSDGRLTTIEELYRNREAHLLTLGNDWRLGWTNASHFVDDGIKPLFRVTTKSGRQIETTWTHPFRTLKGWTPLSGISVGDRVGLPRRIPVFGSLAPSLSIVRALAYLSGLDADSPFPGAHHSSELHQDFTEMLRESEVSAEAWEKRFAEGRRNFLARRGLPSLAFRLDEESLAAYLARVLAIRGRFHVIGKEPLFRYKAPSEKHARHLQHLLLRFGVLCSLRAKRGGWVLDITHLESLGVLGRDVRVIGETRLSGKYVDKPRSVKNGADTFPAEIWERVRKHSDSGPSATWLRRKKRSRVRGRHWIDADGVISRRRLTEIAISQESTELLEMAQGDVMWDEVVRIEERGAGQVYDLTIPETHNFVANDICVHNTAFTLNIAQHAAITAKKPVAFFSLEMSKESLVQRLITSEARVDSTRVRTGRLRDDDYPRIAQAAGILNTAPLYIDDTPAISVLEARAKARRLKSDHPDLSLIVIDYLQLMQGASKSENRQQEVSEISRGLKALAKELSVPVIALSQLSRAVESRPDKRPMMSDLRECVTGETKVVLADGRRVPIRDLVGTQPEVVSVSPEGRLLKAQSDLVWSVGVKPVFKIRLASGREIRATGEHRLLGRSGWIHVRDLKKDDRLAGASTFEGSNSQPMGTDDLFWDEIVEIAPDGEEEVFDLTVPGPESWLADGIVSHNSGAIEQDSDLIMFLYRPEYYHGTTDKDGNSIEGRAEVIIGKQRNGATGTVPLYFHKEITRFEDMSPRIAPGVEL